MAPPATPSDSNDDKVVMEYLTHVAEAAATLCLLPNQENAPTAVSSSNAEHLVRQIAQQLLRASDARLLQSPLPEPLVQLERKKKEAKPKQLLLLNESDDEEHFPDWSTTRSDYLRMLLRGLPPIALDVAAQICSLLVDSVSENKIPIHMAAAAYILFSKWLPIAPQLAPLVSDLFELAMFPCPFEYQRDNENVQLVLAEATHALYEYYAKQSQHSNLKSWWLWGPLIRMLIQNDDDDVVMKDTDGECSHFEYRDAIKWHAARAIGYVMDLRPAAFAEYLDRLEVRTDRVPWMPHPWIVDQEEERTQFRFLRGNVSLLDWNEDERIIASAKQVRRVLPLNSLLVHVGDGIVLVKNRGMEQLVTNHNNAMQQDEPTRRNSLILTPTTSQNLALLGAAMCSDPYPLPILVCGPPGSGKSSLVRELAHFCCPSADDLLELHVDDETDSKTLIGSYTTTDIPGEFTWRPGALTQAVRSGKWVLMEDVDSVPMEIQAAIVQLLENRILPLGGGKFEKCHSSFRLFGTCSTNPNDPLGKDWTDEMKSLRLTGKKLLNPSLWRKVHVQPLAFSELKQIGESLHPTLPSVVTEAALNILKVLDESGRTDISENENVDTGTLPNEAMVTSLSYQLTPGRHASVRDFLKLLSRISHTVVFEHNISYATEAQRTLCLAETVDVFAASCPSLDQKKAFITQVAAPFWGITGELALNYIEARQPSITNGSNCVEIGRAKIPNASHGKQADEDSQNFAATNFSLRLMESIAVCITENESTLLVGETGCGKTSMLQQLARYAGRDLIVQNLSLQTDSTDLLGGYRPLEITHIARKVYLEFVDIFVATFSRKQNGDFLKFTSSMFEKKQWKRLAQCFTRAAALGMAKIRERNVDNHLVDPSVPGLGAWSLFSDRAEQFERQRLACDSGLAFAFTEGALVDAIRTGKWVLLDEFNLASSETLQRLCGLLDDSTGSVTLTERGDSHALKRHPDFRLFAAMNPATDAGKKDLPPSIRARFSELYVDELLDSVELRTVAAKYLRDVGSIHGNSLEGSETSGRAVDIYLKCRNLAEDKLSDSSGHKPRYTMRTMCRALSATRNLALQQKLSSDRSMLEGFELAFAGALDTTSSEAVQRVLRSHLGKRLTRSELDHPPRRPNSRDDKQYVLIKPFWLKAGPRDPVDWSEANIPGKSKFILTESMSHNLRRLSRAVAAGPWPVLLEGPTSAGKTTLIEYLASRCGHEVVRINNHEHTDVQEYTGGYSSDANGSLSFQDGILVRALRRGHWVILDELNLAPSEVLEALNRLLDDNRELYLPEIDETIKPHPNFRLFATQNPSGAYGGRKPLSRAFRNRFVEIHMGDIPSDEMKTILEKRCSCPPSHAKALVKIMLALRQRRNAHGVFLGKDGLITPRDLLRWAERGGSSKLALAQEGYMLLAERLRNDAEKAIVKEEIESHLKVTIDCDDIYYGKDAEARVMLAKAALEQSSSGLSLSSVAPTKSLLRLLTLVSRCVQQKEPVLLVGETGCGKTTVVQLLQEILDRDLHIINCHATTETSDLIGGLRPVRGRGQIGNEIRTKFREFLSVYPNRDSLESTLLSSSDEYTQSGQFRDACDYEDDHCLSEGSLKMILSSIESLWDRVSMDHEPTIAIHKESPKKRKLDSGLSLGVGQDQTLKPETLSRLKELIVEINVLARRYAALFEWADGPLVNSMRSGQLLLMDEMSLAEDAVLERLNSVLEPSRTLVLAEKGTDTFDENDSNTVVGHDNFRIFATMNPGGDFGKRELSPALRSRFTEIWVPQVTDPSDIEMVLDHTLASVSVRCDHESLKTKILNYVNFFNVTICGDKSSPCCELELSLRDVLAWARFVVDVSNSNEDMDPWTLYCHGACLMHLDGLGLGTGLSSEDANLAKKKATSFLLDEVPTEARSICNDTFSTNSRRALVSDHRFGMHPFTIETGRYPKPNSTFDFEAPTPSLNLLRVLRAMQISKPILLEGSPGVGKTSLAAGIAAASGHRLVRINLSEQTDMSDLMGSDLPNVDHDRNAGGESGVSQSASSFKWCDGVLLRAIKQGDWVLLDELNLASQSVLEGLNSLLDHRSSVYIPELGKTFHCPSTFKIFAAQNPLAQGGGRKGLPKSFLNRFTKVYVESLTEGDLHSIVAARFPSVPTAMASSMILFNKQIHQEIVERREYGDSGSPWEFNLRDVFRWCELVVANGDTSEIQLARFANFIYLERFRSVEDRMRLDSSYQEYFGRSLLELPPPELKLTDQKVNIGSAVLKRFGTSVDASSGQLFGEDSSVARSLLGPMEAVATCITKKWPCLLVGVSGSGKSSTLNSLAEFCNASLIDVSLTPSTDVNELVGSFEQVDSGEDQKEARQLLCTIRNAAVMYLTVSPDDLLLQEKLLPLFQSFDCGSIAEMAEAGDEIESMLALALNRNDEFRSHCQTHVEHFRAIVKRIASTVRGAVERDNAHFRWVDGILVTAMKRGYWLHLENVNLCPASVLDRLNPVMEQDGELLLTECAVKDSASNGTSHEVVKQHPNFRMFLSMNPANGEISRAMRNRCVEISLLSSSRGDDTAIMSAKALVDGQDALFSTGIRSMRLATFILELHTAEIARASVRGAEVPSSKHIREWGRLSKGLYSRGLDAHFSLETACRLAYEFWKEQSRIFIPRSELQELTLEESSALLQSPSIRWDFSFRPSQVELEVDTRLVKAFAGQEQAPLNIKSMFPITDVVINQARTQSRLDLDNMYQPDWFPIMQWNLLALYLGKACAVDIQARCRTLNGYSGIAADSLRFMASLLSKVIAVSNQSSVPVPTGIVSCRPLQDDSVLAVHLRRMPQLVREHVTYGLVSSLDSNSVVTKEMSAIEVSWCLSEGKMDRASVSCPATTLLYPLFCAFDKWVFSLITSVPEIVSWICRQSSQLESLLEQRDQMWLCLQHCIYEGISPSRLLGFEESGFIVQWIWLKKRLLAFVAGAQLVGVQEPLLNKFKQQLDTLVVAIDRVLFNSGDGLSRSSDTLWKKGGHPLVPRQARQWETMSLLERASHDCVLMTESSRSVELQKLIDSSSPILFLDMKDKAELLAALCMCFLLSTDEVQSKDDSHSSQEIQKVVEVISKDLAQRRLSFEEQVRASRVDIEIATIENMMDVEKLSSLRETVTSVDDGGNKNNVLGSLMLRFAKIQVSPLAEFWCVREEAALIGVLTEILITSSEDWDSAFNKIRSLESRFRFFVKVVLSYTCLSVVDIRPYQTLLWVIGDSGVGGKDVVHLLRCIIPRMTSALSRHSWVNSFNDLNSISDKLEMPKLWLWDERNVFFEDISAGESDNGVNESRRGPPGLTQHVKTEFVFRFVGSDVSSMFNIANKSMYATIENHSARKEQARDILTILSMLKLSPQRQHDLYQVLYLFANTIEALRDFFPGETARTILSFLRDTEALQSVDQYYAFELFAGCEHSTFRKCLDSAVYPLFMSLQSVSRNALPEKNQALAWVYVGLLRMNLLSPCSPLDPGKKPIAKVAEHDRYLTSLRGKLTALQLDSLFIRGIPAPDSSYFMNLLSETKRTEGKRSKQELKMIERAANAPPYIDFFRESQRFSQAISATEGVSAVVRAISEAAKDITKIRSAKNREQNWQATSGSFCSRLVSHFAPYEDVALPFINAIENIRDGVRLLAQLHLYPSEPNMALDSLLEFPMGNQLASSDISAILPRIGTFSLPSTSRPGDLKRSRFALSLALLCRMDLRKRLGGGKLSLQDLAESHSVFGSVASAWSLERDGSTNDSAESPEVLLEEEYREQFPDHGQEFHSLLSTITIEMEDAYDPDEVEQPDINDEEDWSLAEDQIAILCSLHRDLYLPTGSIVNDQSRTRTMCSAYSAAYHLSQMSPVALARSSDNTEQVGAHIMTLALCSAGSSRSVLADTGSVSDFHRDANPAEVAKATEPLDMLLSRVSQLLSAFPGHSVLIALVRVADHVRKLPLSTTSVGKAMHGLEIILQKAQAWEQHASSHVKLGTSLQNVSKLVASWRKLELQSWGTLLEARSKRYAKRARRHWPRLYNVLVNGTEHKSSASTLNNCSVEAPNWVWKGLRTGMGAFVCSSTQYEVDGAMIDLSRVMDTFLLSSSLGEFHGRLKLVETFAYQMTLIRPSVARLLFSLVSFYKQFVPLLETRLTELRRPIEARLKDEVKLAKWDEQSYYALQDSTERNHRKLMKLLREYDDVLELPVSSILERHLCHGIRSIEASNEEPCSSIPAYRVLFPFVEQLSGTIDLGSTIAALPLVTTGTRWADPEVVGIRCDKYVSRMGHYARRMSTILGSKNFKLSAWSQVGPENANDLCEAIFDRIESLRKENTPKTMKQRALVDLFKTLKNNGYLQTKWSVPPEVREMAHLFQLPGFVKSNSSLTAKEGEVLRDTESYFQRTTAEVNRLRSEVLVLGSKHMSQRETHIMLSLAEHGLMMLCQQRCVLARLLQPVSDLDDLTECCDTWHCLPIGQTNLRETLQEFNEACISVEENLKQLQLLMKTSSSLVDGQAKVEATRDLISITESCVSRIQAIRVSSIPNVLTHADIARAREAGSTLEDISQLVCDSQNSCEKSQCLPPEVFNSCISEINRACTVFSRLSGETNSDDTHNPPKEDSSVVMSAASRVVQKVLLAVQTLFKESDANDDHLEDTAIFSCHALASKELASINLGDVIEATSVLNQELLSLHESDRVPKARRDCCTSVVSGANTFARSLVQVSKQRIGNYLVFARSLAKLNYVLVRVFRVLVSKGYCADNITNDEDGDGEGDISGMNFEDDKEGTGMGEGDGKQDVTDQLESEEQLLGLKGEDQDDTTTEQRDSKELNEEEAKQGMEMEADFEGDMFDVPDQSQDDDPDPDDDKEQELDREMGDGPDQNEDIVDEKMWDQSDDEGEQDPADEKFEKDSSMKGQSLEDELRTKDEDEPQKGADATKDESNEAKSAENEDTGADESMPDKPEINDDLEDNYEEKAPSVDIRDEHKEADEEDESGNDGDEAMELEENLNLDENDDGETEEGNDAMGTEDQGIEETTQDDDEIPDSGMAGEDGDGESGSDSSDVDTDHVESGGHKGDGNDEGEKPPEGENEDDIELPEVEFSGNDSAQQDMLGVQSKDGKDNITENIDEGQEEDTNGMGDNDDPGNADEAPPQAQSGGTSGVGEDAGSNGESSPDDGATGKEKDSVSAPNPFQSPGDATKFWYKKLRMLEGSTDEKVEEDEARNDEVNENGDGEFEFSSKDQDSSTQVLGKADDEEAARIEELKEEENQDSQTETANVPEEKERPSENQTRSKNSGRKSGTEKQTATDEGEMDESDSEVLPDDDMEVEELKVSDEESVGDGCNAVGSDDAGNRVVTDLSQLNVNGSADSLSKDEQWHSLVQEEAYAMTTDADLTAARSHWSEIQGETHHLARRLCEKLRLVMEPLVATKLKGDYRTGKRINMKRVIGYIASGYRKDKIWLRRTKPAKRNYRVLLAVDNSESMHKSGAGEMALAAMATLAVGMSQLEIGELGVASFGEEMRLLHPFHQPFTSESGVKVVQNFPFDEKRTRTALCVESALSALESQGDSASMQLVFMISDGRIERDSRDELRRLVREMVERNVLLVMIVVEGSKNGPAKKKDSIVHMKEVTFKNGKPSVKQFIEDYPFPYYMVLEDMQSLPELLGTALSQWFEMLAHIQGSSR